MEVWSGGLQLYLNGFQAGSKWILEWIECDTDNVGYTYQVNSLNSNRVEGDES